MNCQDRRDQLLLYVLGGLDAAESNELRAHLATGCPTCAGSLAEAEATVASLPEALEPMAPPARVLERLMQQVKTSPRASAPSAAHRERALVETAKPPRPLPWLTLVALAASIMLALTTGFQQTRIMRQQIELQESTGQLATLREETDLLKRQSVELKQQVEVATRTIEALQTRNVRLVTLAGAEAQPGAWGHILWDEQRRRWHLFISGMKPAGAGKTYELWFVTKEQRKIPAGLFDVDAAGRATLSVSLPGDLGPLALAAITDEPKSGSPQPTGSFQLLGEIN